MSKCMKGCIAAPALVTVLLSATCARSQAPDINQRIERFTRPSVVMIVAGCQGSYNYRDASKSFSYNDLSELGYGSGYFVTSNGYIVTNAHVVKYVSEGKGEESCKEKLFEKFITELAPTLGKKPEDILNNKTLRDQIRKKSALKDKSFESTRQIILPNQANQEPLPFQITEAGDPDTRDVAVLKVEGVDAAPVLMMGNSDNVQNTDRVLIFGYPTDSFISDTLKLESGFKPSVTIGSIANTKIILKNGAPVLQVQASVSPGNSGGPVINAAGETIGMVTFRKGEGSPGIFYAIPTKTVKDVLGEASVKNEQGPADDLYRKGLEYYWKGNYSDAIAQFNQVKGKFRRHSEVEDLILDSEAKRPKYPPLWLLLAIAATVAAIPILGFILYRRGLVPAGDGAVGSVLDRVTGIWHPTSEAQPKRQTILDVPSSGRLGVSQSFVELETRLSSTPLQFYLNQDVHHIGRDSEWSDIEIPEQGWEVISRRHAVLRREGANYRIFDGDGKPSANGIWSDGERIDPVKGFLLTNGAQLQFGQNPQTQVTLTYFNPTGKAALKPTYVD